PATAVVASGAFPENSSYWADHSIVILQDGSVWGLGADGYAQLGIGYYIDMVSAPSKVIGANSVCYFNVNLSYVETCTPVSGATVLPVTLDLDEGDTASVTAEIVPANASNKAVFWRSSDNSVATVSQSGLVTAKGPGTAVISVETLDSGKTATCSVTVTRRVSGVTLSVTSASFLAGMTAQLKATVSPSDASNKALTWSSNNTKTATVNDTGHVTAVGGGEAIITVTTVDGGYTATCLVTVTQRVSGVTITPASLSVEVGMSSALTAKVLPSDASYKAVTWASSDNNVATISTSGFVTGISVGTATITVTTADGAKTANAKISVTKPQPVKVTVSGKLQVGQTLTATTTLAAAGTTYQWLRNGVAIAGATAKTYKLTEADLGARLSVQLNVPGAAGPVVSAAQGPVAPVQVVPDTCPVQVVLSPSLAGAKFGDVLKVDANGTLWRYPSSATGALGARTQIGTTGSFCTLTVYAPGDWDNNGTNDVITVDKASGKMYLYAGSGKGSIGAPMQIGQGWQDFRVVPSGDLNGDGFVDLLAINNSTGDLFLYAGNGKGGFKYPYPKVGYGWKGFELYAAGDVNNDGKADILSIDGAGNLFFYAGRGDGTFAKKIQVGNGWKGYTLAAGADLNGDGYADIVGVDSKGVLYFYPAKGQGAFAKKVQIDTGW
ncbi:MAG: Ig-like domain-containing protein, partial [Micrococcales bacterium]|nr:Ig-like domain-containing protein [Micrococcales bacterium]